MSRLRFAVLGGGNGAFATAGDLALRGFPVALAELPQFGDTVAQIARRGGLEVEALEGSGCPSGFARLELITTDVGQAVKEADVVIVVVPGYGQRPFLEAALPHLRDGQVLWLVPGAFGGSLAFEALVRQQGLREKVLVAEAEGLIYTCRKKAPDRIWIKGYKRGMRVAALPAARTEEALSVLRQAYPGLLPASNVLEVALRSTSPVIHAPIQLSNSARIDGADTDFLFYWKGVSPAVGRAIETLDEERLALARAMGFKLPSVVEQMRAWYAAQGAKGDSAYELFTTNPIYEWTKAPDRLDDRYLTEDVPFGLVPMADLANRVGTPNKAITSAAGFASLLLGRDLTREGRTLESLGIGDLSLPELLAHVNGSRGERPDQEK